MKNRKISKKRKFWTYGGMLLAICCVTAMVANLTGCLTSCSNTAWKSENGNPSLANRKEWKQFLKVRNADPSKPIGTTMTHIGNVSHKMAVAKMNQALQSYFDDLGYKLSSVFELTSVDETEQTVDDSKKTDHGEPAVSTMVVQGHLYFVGMLDYRKNDDTYAEYEQTQGVIPAIVVVDGEDATKAAWVRTRDETGKPYHIVLRFSEMVTRDDNNIYRHLRNRGYSTSLSCNSLDNPTLEVDDSWRPFFTLTWNREANCSLSNGSMIYPEKLLVVDAQTTDDSGLKAYQLDNPTTPQNERDPSIPKWIDQVYSPTIAKAYIMAWAYNPENYGKSSKMNDFTIDGNHLDEVMNAANTNIVYVAYITSHNIDDALIGVMLFDPQDGTAEFYETQGIHAMATKTSALNAIRQATHRWDYNVEDLTLHTIYGVPTWQGELTRPAVDDDGSEYGSLYCGMVMLQANYDHQPQHVRWGFDKRDVFTKYERWVIQSQTKRIGSNVDEKKEITATVTRVQTIVIDGNTDFVISVAERPGTFTVPIDFLGDPNSEEVLAVQPGHKVYMKYADPVNTQTYLVLEIHNLSQVRVAETKVNEHFEDKKS
jgi:hypothetical protein